MLNPRVAHCVFCEDIRHEMGNKFSMMGVFTNELIFAGTYPTVMPTFAVVAWLICDIGDEPSEITMRLVGPPNPAGETTLITGQFKNITVQPSDGSTKAQIRVIMQMSPLPLVSDGHLEAYIDTEAGSLRAGRLRIKSQPPKSSMPDSTSSNEPSQPAKRSRAARKKRAKKP
jgi:hypothetical protein